MIPLPPHAHSRNSGTFDPLYTAYQMREYSAAHVTAERERCARLIERTDLGGLMNGPAGWLAYTASLCNAFADLIRAGSAGGEG